MHKQEICFFLVYIFRKEIFLMRFDTFVRFLLSLSELRSLISFELRKRRASTLETDFCCYRSYHSCHRKLFPQSHNLLANSLTSLACGIQVETFRKIHGNGIATTMCIGNLRSGTQNIYTFFQTKKRDSLEKGLLYYGIILCFICGATIGNQCIKYLHERATLYLLLYSYFSFIMMFRTRDEAVKSRKIRNFLYSKFLVF